MGVSPNHHPVVMDDNLTHGDAEHHDQAPIARSPQLVDLLRQQPNGTLRLLFAGASIPGGIPGEYPQQKSH